MDEPESDDEDEVTGVERDDERSGTKYNVSVFSPACDSARPDIDAFDSPC